MEGPLQALAGLSGNACPGAWGGSGPPVPTKGPKEGCCCMPLHTFAICSFCYGVDFNLDSIPISNHSISVSARYEVGL